MATPNVARGARAVVTGVAAAALLACSAPPQASRSDDALIPRVDISSTTPLAKKKKPVCTVWSDPDSCEEPPPDPSPPPVEYDYAVVLTDTSADIDFSTNNGAVDVDVVVAPGLATPPDDLARAKAAAGAAWKLETRSAIHDHVVPFLTLAPCLVHWYGLYVGGVLQRSGTFTTTPPGGMGLAVRAAPTTRAASMALDVAPGAPSGYLDIDLVSADRAHRVSQSGDRHTTGAETRTVSGLLPGTHYSYSVHGCGETVVGGLDTPALGGQTQSWASGELGAMSATATAWLMIDDAGNWAFKGWADAGGVAGVDYVFTMSFDTPDSSGKIVLVQNPGTVHGTWALGSSHDEWKQFGNSPAIAAAFDSLKRSRVHSRFDASTNAWDVVQAVLLNVGAVVGATGATVLSGHAAGVDDCTKHPDWC